MIPAGSAGHPHVSGFVGAGFQVFGAERVEAATGNLELVSRLAGAEPQFPKAIQHVTNEGRSMPMKQLLVLFKSIDEQLIWMTPPKPI
jgi:hypothetical protein